MSRQPRHDPSSPRSADAATPALDNPHPSEPSQISERPPRERHLWDIPAARDFSFLALIGFCLWFLYSLRSIFVPVFLALLLAHVANPLVTAVERRWHLPRPLSAALLTLSGILACTLFFASLGPLLLEQVTALLQRLPEYVSAFAARHGVETGDFLNLFHTSLSDLQMNLQTIVEQLFKTTGQALDLVTTLFSIALGLLLSLALFFFYFFVFAWHFNSGVERAARYLPSSAAPRAREIFSRMDRAVGDFFRGRLVIAIVMGILLSIGWFFAGVPYWFFLGIVTGLLNIVPYLSVVTWPAAVLLKYAESLTLGEAELSLWTIALWPSLVYIVVQLLESWILTPWIQSTQTNLSAPTIIIVVFIGAAVAGALGMLLAIPVTACAKILLDELLLPRFRYWARNH